MEEVVTLPPGIRLSVAVDQLAQRFGYAAILSEVSTMLAFQRKFLPLEQRGKIDTAHVQLGRVVSLVGEVEAAQEDVG